MKTRKRNKKGISLIVLVITIIVMIILATAVILSLSSNGIIDRANVAVKGTDEKNMQTLASTLWGEAYIDFEAGLIDENELIARVDEGLYKADNEYKTKYEVNISKEGVSLEIDKSFWLEIGGGGTADYLEYMFLIMRGGNWPTVGTTYRLTIESRTYKGIVDVSTIALDEEEGIAGWMFYIDNEGKVESLNSIDKGLTYLNDYFEGKLSGDVWLCQNGDVAIYSLEAAPTDIYKIMKIEMKLPEDTVKIYEGSIKGSINNNIELEGIKIDRDYAILANATINTGEATITMPIALRTTGGGWFGEAYSLVGDSTTNISVALISNNMIKLFPIIDKQLVTMEIKEIYDLGPSKHVVRQDEFVLTTKGNLIATPNGEYVIPQNINGVPVKSIALEALSGTPTINHYLEVTSGDVNGITKIIIKNEAQKVISDYAQAFIQNCGPNPDVGLEIDVIDCGDDVVLPKVWLENQCKVYVTQNVKNSLYSTNDNVIGK